MNNQVIAIIKKIGLLIQTTRLNKKMTINNLSDVTGIHRNTISKIENGIYDCQLSKYLTIFAALELDLQQVSKLIKSLYSVKT